MNPESSVVFLPCKNIRKTRRFYETVVGCKLYKDMDNCILMDTGYGYIGFVKYGDGREMATGVCVSINLEDRKAVDEKFQELLSSGICKDSDAPKEHSEFPVYSFFLKDPNGYTLEFQRILEYTFDGYSF